jgi:hypothetical protein
VYKGVPTIRQLHITRALDTLVGVSTRLTGDAAVYCCHVERSDRLLPVKGANPVYLEEANTDAVISSTAPLLIIIIHYCITEQGTLPTSTEQNIYPYRWRYQRP